MKWAVVVFPGSNCEEDCYRVLREVVGVRAEYVWHQERSLAGFDAAVLPGGFSYGDYLRPGALASLAPVLDGVRELAARGGPVLGICNGFQILCEAGLLPGGLLPNAGLRFVCAPCWVRVETARTPFTAGLRPGTVLQLPVAHRDGCYHAPPAVLDRLRREDRVVLRYSTPAGELAPAANPNGSADHIAALCNEAGNVVGMMPHPERSAEPILGSADGRLLLEAAVRELAGRTAQPAAGRVRR